MAQFGSLYYFLSFFGTIWVSWAFYAVLLKFRFVVIYALFRVKYFGSNHACVKKLSFCMSAPDVLIFCEKVMWHITSVHRSMQCSIPMKIRGGIGFSETWAYGLSTEQLFSRIFFFFTCIYILSNIYVHYAILHWTAM